MAELRERRFTLIVGMPGAGKSTFTNDMLNRYQGNVILYKHIANIDDPAFDTLPQKTTDNWRQGAHHPMAPVKCKIAGDTGKPYIEFLNWVKGNFRNGALIIDDATIFERDRLTQEMNHLVAMRRHYGIDIYLIYHGLTLLPIEQFIFVNYIVLFNTNDNLKYKASRLPTNDMLMRGVQQARQNYAQGGKTQYTPAIVRLS